MERVKWKIERKTPKSTIIWEATKEGDEEEGDEERLDEIEYEQVEKPSIASGVK
jgi:hypothetical protein